MGHRKISAAIKVEAVRLVIDGGHTAPQAAKLMGVGPTALRRWVDEWQAQQATMPPCPRRWPSSSSLLPSSGTS